jgi:putative hydrolase of the HAD superfamily
VSVVSLGGRAVEFDTVVFDLFHTLVDPQQHAAPGFRRLRAVAGILDLPIADIELWWHQRLDEFVSTPVSPVDGLVNFAASRRIVLSPTAVAELDRAMGAAQDAALAEPITGVLDTLDWLRAAGVLRVVLSNAVVRDVRAFGESPLAPLVDDACMSCFTGLVKPDPAAYLGALARAGRSADRTLFVGDGGSDEFSGARAAGLAAVVAITGPVQRGGWRSPDQQQLIVADADAEIVDVSDLLGLVER